MGQVMLLFILKTIRLKCQLLKAGSIVNAYGIQGSLPDHDYVMAPQRKLIPSVILDMCIQEKDSSGNAVTYSGPTYCAIRKLKHSGSSVFHHLQNMKHIRSLDIFDDSFNNDTGKSEPVMIVMINAGVWMKIQETQKLSNAWSIISPPRILMRSF